MKMGKRHSSATWFYKNCYNNKLSGTGDCIAGFLFSAVMNRAEGLGQVTFPLALWEVSCCLNNGLADAIV